MPEASRRLWSRVTPDSAQVQPWAGTAMVTWPQYTRRTEGGGCGCRRGRHRVLRQARRPYMHACMHGEAGRNPGAQLAVNACCMLLIQWQWDISTRSVRQRDACRLCQMEHRVRFTRLLRRIDTPCRGMPAAQSGREVRVAVPALAGSPDGQR